MAQRDAVEIFWDPSEVGKSSDKVDLRVRDGDKWSTVKPDIKNDGKAVVTFPEKYSGTLRTRVVGPYGHDERTYEVK